MDRRYLVFPCAALILLLVCAGCTTPEPAAAQAVTPNSTPGPAMTFTTPFGGTCSGNLSYCALDAACHDLRADIGNCGACGDVCPGNTSCISGRCYCRDGYDVEGTACIRTPEPESTSSPPVIANKDNGCPPDMTPCSDNYCHFLQSDSNNCGACGNKCPVGLVCEMDICYSPSSNSAIYVDEWGDTRSVNNYNPYEVPFDKGCPAGMTACPDNICYFLGSNSDNCGFCGNICPAGLVCSGSTCMNPASTIEPTVTPTVFITGITNPDQVYCPSLGLTYCSGGCVDTRTDAENCGSCGNSCGSPDSVCCGGRCVDINRDHANCGSCNKVCTATSSCDTGICTPKIVPAIPKETGSP